MNRETAALKMPADPAESRTPMYLEDSFPQSAPVIPRKNDVRLDDIRRGQRLVTRNYRPATDPSTVAEGSSWPTKKGLVTVNGVGTTSYSDWERSQPMSTVPDPQASRAPSYLEDTFPQMINPSDVVGEWTTTALSVDRPIIAERPSTDGSTAVAGGSWPTLKGFVTVAGVGTTSYHDWETAQPLKARNPDERGRPTLLSDTLAADNARVLYGNQFDLNLNTGSTHDNDATSVADWQVQPRRATDPRYSRAPSYWDDNWPQMTSPSSTDGRWTTTALSIGLPISADRPKTDGSTATAGGSWPTLKGYETIRGIGNLSYHDREASQPLIAANPDERPRPSYKADTLNEDYYGHQFDYDLRTGETHSTDSTMTATRQTQSWRAPDRRFSRAPSYDTDNWPQGTTSSSTPVDSRPATDDSTIANGESRPNLHGQEMIHPYHGNPGNNNLSPDSQGGAFENTFPDPADSRSASWDQDSWPQMQGQLHLQPGSTDVNVDYWHSSSIGHNQMTTNVDWSDSPPQEFANAFDKDGVLQLMHEGSRPDTDLSGDGAHPESDPSVAAGGEVDSCGSAGGNCRYHAEYSSGAGGGPTVWGGETAAPKYQPPHPRLTTNKNAFDASQTEPDHFQAQSKTNHKPDPRMSRTPSWTDDNWPENQHHTSVETPFEENTTATSASLGAGEAPHGGQELGEAVGLEHFIYAGAGRTSRPATDEWQYDSLTGHGNYLKQHLLQYDPLTGHGSQHPSWPRVDDSHLNPEWWDHDRQLGTIEPQVSQYDAMTGHAIQNPSWPRASQPHNEDAGSEDGWQRVWDARGTNSMDETDIIDRYARSLDHFNAMSRPDTDPVATRGWGQGHPGDNNHMNVQRSHNAAGGLRHTLNGLLKVVGVGTDSFMNWENADPEAEAPDPAASRSPMYEEDSFPQMTHERPVQDRKVLDDNRRGTEFINPNRRPATDPSTVAEGSSWPTKKGLVTVNGVGTTSYSDWERSQPMSTVPDPQASRAPSYLEDTFPQMINPSDVVGEWTTTALSVDRPIIAERPSTDGSTAVAGGSWPTLKGFVTVAGVGTTSYHDWETAQPLKARNPDERGRPTLLSDTLAADNARVLYGNQFDLNLNTGSTHDNDATSVADWQVQPRRATDPRYSRAPSYWDDNWPQMTSPSSTDGRWTTTALSIGLPISADRPKTDGSTATAGGSWPTLKGYETIRGIGNLSYHDREASQPLIAANPDERPRPSYKADTLNEDYYGHQFDYDLRTGETHSTDSTMTATRQTQSWRAPDRRFSRAPSYDTDNWLQGTSSSSTLGHSRPPTDEW